MDITTRDRLAMTPYAATPIFPAIPRMIVLNTIITIPDETSVISEGRPLEKIPSASFPDILHFLRWNWFFLLKRYGERTNMLMTGAIPVASTAPKMPIPKGNMNT